MAKRYKVLIGIQNDKLHRRHEPGEVVELNEPEWDVKGLKAIGAVEEADTDPLTNIFVTDQEAIRGMVETGDVAGAQKIILDRLTGSN